MTRARRRQAAAIGALVAYVVMLVLVLLSIRDHPGQLLSAWVLLVVASAAGWVALTRTRVIRALGLVVAIAALAGAVVLLLGDTALLQVVVLVGFALLATALARYAVGVDDTMLREAPPPGRPVPKPQRPVLLMNPWSGGGKVGRFDLPHEAERRGIEPIVLTRGDDLAALARDAVSRGADLLGMAGGDGSQALVAGIASEHGLPFVCIPAGTRNHLALDLGVDRDDVLGSLDAYTDGYERTVDLATVNGDIFVNNVSLGVYAEIVQSDDYRGAKVQTTASMLPELLGRDAHAFDFVLDRIDGSTVEGPCLVLVSNNVYELTRLSGFGGRARIDEGVLGVVTLRLETAGDVARLLALETAGHVDRARGWEAWSAASVEVRSQRPVAAGVDGEARTYDAPLRFEMRPAALAVRVARGAPGVSPTHVAHRVRHAGIGTLARVAVGRGEDT